MVRAFLLSVLLATPATAQIRTVLAPIQCGPSDSLLDTLREKWMESRILVGKVAAETEMSVWVNNETGAFTVIHIKDGIGCIISIGKELDLGNEPHSLEDTPNGDPL